jgi:hypothetical protein
VAYLSSKEGTDLVYQCCGIYAQSCNCTESVLLNLIHSTSLVHGMQHIEVRAMFSNELINFGDKKKSVSVGARGKALRYKVGGRGFDTQ